MTSQPVSPRTVTPSMDARDPEIEAGRPVWALLGLLAAVSVAVVIIALGFSAA